MDFRAILEVGPWAPMENPFFSRFIGIMRHSIYIYIHIYIYVYLINDEPIVIVISPLQKSLREVNRSTFQPQLSCMSHAEVAHVRAPPSLLAWKVFNINIDIVFVHINSEGVYNVAYVDSE